MSVVAEPVHVGPAVVKRMNELMCDHSGHMGLLVDVVLTQNNLQTTTTLITLNSQILSKPSEEPVLSLFLPGSPSYL